jgi:gluconate kinase
MIMGERKFRLENYYSIHRRYIDTISNLIDIAIELRNVDKIMKTTLATSQLAAIEEPMIDEVDVLPVNTAGSGLRDLVEGIMDVLGL